MNRYEQDMYKDIGRLAKALEKLVKVMEKLLKHKENDRRIDRKNKTI